MRKIGTNVPFFAENLCYHFFEPDYRDMQHVPDFVEPGVALDKEACPICQICPFCPVKSPKSAI